MPRRRRASTFEKKPKLVFVESPVHVAKNVPSPVLCARHPPTAQSIHIEDMQSLAWVSPQFNPNLASFSGQKRRRRRVAHRRHSIATPTVTKSLPAADKENVSANHVVTRMRKYNSLKFVGEKSLKASVIEEVDISVETSDSEGLANVIDEISDSSVTSNRISYRTRLRAINSLQDRSVPNILDEVSSERMDQVTDMSEVCVENHINRTVSVENHGNRKAVENHGNRKTSVENHGIRKTSVENHGNRKTSLENHGNRKISAPIKRLFQSQVQLLENDESTENSDSNDTSAIPKRKNIKKSKLLLEEISETSEEDIQLPQVRKSARIQHMKKLLSLDSTPKHSREKSVMVLAPDTPEARYGWTIREKQLCNHEIIEKRN